MQICMQEHVFNFDGVIFAKEILFVTIIIKSLLLSENKTKKLQLRPLPGGDPICTCCSPVLSFLVPLKQTLCLCSKLWHDINLGTVQSFRPLYTQLCNVHSVVTKNILNELNFPFSLWLVAHLCTYSPCFLFLCCLWRSQQIQMKMFFLHIAKFEGGGWIQLWFNIVP